MVKDVTGSEAYFASGFVHGSVQKTMKQEKLIDCNCSCSQPELLFQKRDSWRWFQANRNKREQKKTGCNLPL